MPMALEPQYARPDYYIDAWNTDGEYNWFYDIQYLEYVPMNVHAILINGVCARNDISFKWLDTLTYRITWISIITYTNKYHNSYCNNLPPMLLALKFNNYNESKCHTCLINLPNYIKYLYGNITNSITLIKTKNILSICNLDISNISKMTALNRINVKELRLLSNFKTRVGYNFPTLSKHTTVITFICDKWNSNDCFDYLPHNATHINIMNAYHAYTTQRKYPKYSIGFDNLPISPKRISWIICDTDTQYHGALISAISSDVLLRNIIKCKFRTKTCMDSHCLDGTNFNSFRLKY
jgi:hypothetical protein